MMGRIEDGGSDSTLGQLAEWWIEGICKSEFCSTKMIKLEVQFLEVIGRRMVKFAIAHVRKQTLSAVASYICLPQGRSAPLAQSVI